MTFLWIKLPNRTHSGLKDTVSRKKISNFMDRTINLFHIGEKYEKLSMYSYVSLV